MIEERRDWATRPDDIWRCETCGYHEPRYERAVNAVPGCPHCCRWHCAPGGCWYTWHPPARLWEAVRYG